MALPNVCDNTPPVASQNSATASPTAPPTIGFDGSEDGHSSLSPSLRSPLSQPAQPTTDASPSAAVDGGSALSRLEAPTGRSLFLQGLRADVEYPELFRVFRQFGTVVSCRVLHDAKRGVSRGIGYVNFATAEEAHRALSGLTAKQQMVLSADATRDLLPGGTSGAPVGGDATGFDVKLADHDPHFTEDDARALSVHFIPLHVTEEQVRQAFAEFGPIVGCELTTSAASKQTPPKSATAEQLALPGLVARVEFAEAAHATAAASTLHKTRLFAPNRELYIKPAEPVAKILAREERRVAEREKKRAERQSGPFGSHGAHTFHHAARPARGGAFEAPHAAAPFFGQPPMRHQAAQAFAVGPNGVLYPQSFAPPQGMQMLPFPAPGVAGGHWQPAFVPVASSNGAPPMMVPAGGFPVMQAAVGGALFTPPATPGQRPRPSGSDPSTPSDAMLAAQQSQGFFAPAAQPLTHSEFPSAHAAGANAAGMQWVLVPVPHQQQAMHQLPQQQAATANMPHHLVAGHNSQLMHGAPFEQPQQQPMPVEYHWR